MQPQPATCGCSRASHLRKSRSTLVHQMNTARLCSRSGGGAAAQPEVVVQVGHVGPPVHELHVLQGRCSVVEHQGCGPDDPGVVALAQQPGICGTAPCLSVASPLQPSRTVLASLSVCLDPSATALQENPPILAVICTQG